MSKRIAIPGVSEISLGTAILANKNGIEVLISDNVLIKEKQRK
ncbi:MAG TPA: hypothetical protein VF298_03715 [Bacteroidales bacterium]|jgi:hypothetical protein